jgi:transmembrane sensor
MNAIFMNRQNEIPWNAVSAFLKHEADQQQKDAIADWLKESAENPALLQEIASTWQLTRKTPDFYKPEEEIFWKKLTERIENKRLRKVSFARYYKWTAAAAVLIFIFVSGLWLGNRSLNHRSESAAYAEVVVPPGSRTQTILPDGSRVWLNSGATLRYPAKFGENTREVDASGECYFEVARDKKRRFVVHYTGLSVQVFGTTFNISENAGTNETVVSLLEGNVQVVDHDEQLLASLLPGEQLIFSEGKSRVCEAKNIAALTSWINNTLVFDDQPIQDVISYLQGWYGIKIQTDPDILQSKHRYTFKVKTESLREVLDMIAVITPITYKIEGENVLISYKEKAGS